MRSSERCSTISGVYKKEKKIEATEMTRVVARKGRGSWFWFCFPVAVALLALTAVYSKSSPCTCICISARRLKQQPGSNCIPKVPELWCFQLKV